MMSCPIYLKPFLTMAVLIILNERQNNEKMVVYNGSVGESSLFCASRIRTGWDWRYMADDDRTLYILCSAFQKIVQFDENKNTLGIWYGNWDQIFSGDMQ